MNKKKKKNKETMDKLAEEMTPEKWLKVEYFDEENGDWLRT